MLTKDNYFQQEEDVKQLPHQNNKPSVRVREISKTPFNRVIFQAR